MKFNADLISFQKLIQRITPIIPQKSTIAVLEHFHFSLDGNTLKVIASDKDITVLSTFEVSGIEDGMVLIPAKKLSELLKSYSMEGTIKIDVDTDNFDIFITLPLGKYTLKGLHPDEYLALPELFESQNEELMGVDSDGNIISGINNISLTKDEIQKLSNKTIFAVSNDEFRPAMTGVLFQFREEFINAVATDSFRLVKSTVYLKRVSKIIDSDIIIPAKTIDFLRKIEDLEINISLIENLGKYTHIRFDFGSSILISKLIEEKFPPYEQVIPKDNPFTMIIDKNKLLSSLRRIGLFANKSSYQVRLRIDPTMINLYSQDDETGNYGSEDLDCEFNRDNYEIAFNLNYIEEALANISENDTEGSLIHFTFAESNKPVLILPSNDKYELLMLVMPVRISK